MGSFKDSHFKDFKEYEFFQANGQLGLRHDKTSL